MEFPPGFFNGTFTLPVLIGGLMIQHLVHWLADIVACLCIVANHITSLPSEQKLLSVGTFFVDGILLDWVGWSVEEVLFCVMALVGYFL